MRISSMLRLAVLLLAVAAIPASAKTYIRWTESQVPPSEKLGVRDLVFAWNNGAPALAERARSRGYRVYIEAEPAAVKEIEHAAIAHHLSGIVIRVGDLDSGETQTALASLRRAYPSSKFLVLLPPGKEPRMKGNLVFERNGVLAVSSPTSQPWVDSNIALIRYARMRFPGERLLYTFAWELPAQIDQQRGPSAKDYALAICEAAAVHAGLVLPVYESLQAGLANNEPAAWKFWREVQSALEFAELPEPSGSAGLADVVVAADSYAKSAEPVNLLSRHNIPVRVLASRELSPGSLGRARMLIAFSPFGADSARVAQSFAQSGGTVVLIAAPGEYPWRTLPHSASAEHATTYRVGKGKIVEFAEPVIDPEAFAQDIRGLLGSWGASVSLWNSLTTLVVPYRGPAPGQAVLELVNYAEEPADVQVRMRGEFSSVQYVTPRNTRLQSLKGHFRNGFTEFVIPPFDCSARVYLGGRKASTASAR